MEKLNPEATIDFAKEFTIVAMQNGLVAHGASPAKTAENVVAFYQTILKTINNDKE